MRRYPRVFSRMALGLVAAAETSGSLPRMMRHLAAEQRVDHTVWVYTSLVRLLWSLMIPVAVGALALTQSMWFAIDAGSVQEVIDYIVRRLLVWVPPIWLGIALVDHLLRMVLREPRMAGVRHAILMYLPGFAGWMRLKFYANALLVMHELVRSGESSEEGFARAGDAVSPSPLEKQFRAGQASLSQGGTIQDAVKKLKSLPFTARSSMLTAAQVGRQEQSLENLHEQYAEQMRESPRRVLLAVIAYHLLIFGTIALVVALVWTFNYAAILEKFIEP
jgi:type II secretory pathway component PulF